MKKTMLAVLCLAMTAMTTMAKDNNKSHQGHMNQPRHEKVDPVINMDIVGQMGLSEKKVQQIADLKVKKQDEMKALRAQHQPKADMKQHRAKMHDINEKYRKDMQDIMGTKTYIKYVEKVNDHLAMHKSHVKHHKGHGQKMHKGARMHQRHNGHPQPMQHGPVEKI